MGPPVRGLVHDPLAVYSLRTDYVCCIQTYNRDVTQDENHWWDFWQPMCVRPLNKFKFKRASIFDNFTRLHKLEKLKSITKILMWNWFLFESRRQLWDCNSKKKVEFFFPPQGLQPSPLTLKARVLPISYADPLFLNFKLVWDVFLSQLMTRLIFNTCIKWTHKVSISFTFVSYN